MIKNKGFSAIELMVVIGIIAILLGISIPAYMSWIPNYKLGRDTVDLKSDLEMAKLAAKRENTCIGVLFENNGDRFGEYTIFRDFACDFNRDAGDTIIKYQELSPGDTFVNAGVVPFAFRGSGTTVFAGGGTEYTIDIRGYAANRNTRHIKVELLGRVTIE